MGNASVSATVSFAFSFFLRFFRLISIPFCLFVIVTETVTKSTRYCGFQLQWGEKRWTRWDIVWTRGYGDEWDGGGRGGWFNTESLAGWIPMFLKASLVESNRQSSILNYRFQSESSTLSPSASPHPIPNRNRHRPHHLKIHSYSHMHDIHIRPSSVPCLPPINTVWKSCDKRSPRHGELKRNRSTQTVNTDEKKNKKSCLKPKIMERNKWKAYAKRSNRTVAIVCMLIKN